MSIKSWLAGYALLAAMAGFGALFLLGWSDLSLRCERASGTVDCLIKERLGLGLWTRELEVRDVRAAKLATSGGRGSGLSRAVVSRPVLVSADGKRHAILMGASNVDRKAKKEMLRSVKSFLGDQSRASFELSVRLRNVFGYFGLLMLAFTGFCLWKMAASAIQPPPPANSPSA
ncbi:MAG: hypothetical protein HY549_00295 [Elusimicrobia bacterium]|nr:hypothetical protein [Elusimicrobiota bacterium]